MRDFRKALADMEAKQESDLVYGLVEGCSFKGRTIDFLYNEISSLLRPYFTYPLDGEDYETEAEKVRQSWHSTRRDIYCVLEFYWPNVDPDLEGMMYIWPDVSAKSKLRKGRTPTKIGRALKKMFPVLTDDETSFLVDRVKANLFAKQWSVKSGWLREDFKKAYSYQQAPYENLETTWAKKHMGNSCMRYEFEHLPWHPAEAYASGEFEAIWLEDPEGLIGGRVVVWHDPTGSKVPQTAPIYAVSDAAYDNLYQHLRTMSAATAFDSNMVGALMLALPYSNGYVAPYLDLEPQRLEVVEEQDCEGKTKEYLRVSSDGSVDASRYDGLLFSGSACRCCSCEDPISEDDAYMHDGESYCDYCYNQSFFHCENCEESASNDYSQEVNRQGSVRVYTQQWCECCVRDDAYECTDGTYWHCDDVTQSGEGDWISPDQLDSDYTHCELSGEYWFTDSMVSLDDGTLVTMDGIEHYNLTNKGGSQYIYDRDNHCWFLQLPVTAKEAVSNE